MVSMGNSCEPQTERGMRFAVFVGRRNLREEELNLAGAGESVIRIVPVIQGSKSSGIFQTGPGGGVGRCGLFHVRYHLGNRRLQ
uniref:Tail assembly protein n=1 Tax=Pseudomonas phage PACT201 TaxID=3230130 RepID=A0AAU8GSJ7_9VIRU